MLCITGYSQDYINQCRARIAAQVAAYKHLVAAARQQAVSGTADVEAAIATFEPDFFNNLVLVLDNLFCHRSRVLEKKDGNPLNEVRLVCQSLMHNHSQMVADKSIKFNPAKSILKIQVGDSIRLNEAAFTRLSDAWFAEIESKFLEAEPAAEIMA